MAEPPFSSTTSPRYLLPLPRFISYLSASPRPSPDLPRAPALSPLLHRLCLPLCRQTSASTALLKPAGGVVLQGVEEDHGRLLRRPVHGNEEEAN